MRKKKKKKNPFFYFFIYAFTFTHQFISQYSMWVPLAILPVGSTGTYHFGKFGKAICQITFFTFFFLTIAFNITKQKASYYYYSIIYKFHLSKKKAK